MPLQFAGTGTVAGPPPSGVTDTFDRADSASTLNTASDGTHVWTPYLGTWGISSNQGYCPTLSGGGGIATVDAGIRNCTVEVTLSGLTSNFSGVMVCYDGVNGIFVFRRTILSTNRTTVNASGLNFMVVDGVVWANGDVMKVVTAGNVVTVYHNNSLVGSANASRLGAFLGTQHGLYTTSTAHRFNDFSIVV